MSEEGDARVATISPGQGKMKRRRLLDLLLCTNSSETPQPLERPDGFLSRVLPGMFGALLVLHYVGQWGLRRRKPIIEGIIALTINN